jgi:hypothetical protein
MPQDRSPIQWLLGLDPWLSLVAEKQDTSWSLVLPQVTEAAVVSAVTGRRKGGMGRRRGKGRGDQEKGPPPLGSLSILVVLHATGSCLKAVTA